MDERGAGLCVRLQQSEHDGIPLDVTLDCPAGEVLSLVGPSGSGKSTVLRCIAGIASPRVGQVTVGGATWLDTEAGIALSARARSAGYVFQNYALFPHLSAQGNVEAAMQHVPSGGRAARARALLERVNLKGLEARMPAALSGGQQQRVAVARALARDPAVLLLDEPFSAVDRSTRQILYRELATLRRDLAIPVVLVTHDLDEAAMLSDRMAILHRGRTLQQGAPLEVMTRPASSLVARLVDLRNVFPCDVVSHDTGAGTTTIRALGQSLQCRLADMHPIGAHLNGAIPASHIILHRQDRPSRGERENPVSGRVDEFVAMGEDVAMTLSVDNASERLHLTIPLHVARRNGIFAGARATVSLLADGIHLMRD